jgi:transcriptional regulator with XRE-family HTH domain
VKINEKVLYSYIGNRIKQERLRSNMTQGRLADATGMLRTSIANIETGRQKTTLHVLYKLCSVLQIEATTLLPLTAEVVHTDMIEVDVHGRQGEGPPIAAEFLKQLMEE